MPYIGATGPTGTTGPERFPKRVTISLDDVDGLQELAGATGSSTPGELLDVAVAALQWIVQNKKEGNRIIATKNVPEGIEANELVFDVKAERND